MSPAAPPAGLTLATAACVAGHRPGDDRSPAAPAEGAWGALRGQSSSDAQRSGYGLCRAPSGCGHDRDRPGGVFTGGLSRRCARSWSRHCRSARRRCCTSLAERTTTGGLPVAEVVAAGARAWRAGHFGRRGAACSAGWRTCGRFTQEGADLVIFSGGKGPLRTAGHRVGARTVRPD